MEHLDPNYPLEDLESQAYLLYILFTLINKVLIIRVILLQYMNVVLVLQVVHLVEAESQIKAPNQE